MQLSELRTEIRNITGVSETTTITDAVLNDLINKGHNLLADEANLYEGFATRNSIANTAEYQMVNDSGGSVIAWSKTEDGSNTSSTNLDTMIRIYRVDFDGSQMSRIGIDNISNIGSDLAEVNMTTSKGYYLRQDRLGIFPTPTQVKEIKVYYYHIPPTLSSDGDIPILDVRYHEALVYYGAWKVVERLRDINLIPYMKNEWTEWKMKIVLDRQSRAGESSAIIAYKDF